MHEDLARYFEGMRAYLHDATPAEDFLGEGLATNLTRADGSPIDALEGLALYRWLVLADRRALLEDAAPLARAACDEDVWNAVTERYVATRPTLEWDTARYADGFAEFLAAECDRGVVPPYVAELVELSVLRRRAFLSKVELGNAVFDETVFVRLFSHDVRVAHPGCAVNSKPLKPEARPCVLIVFRSCTTGLVRAIDGTAARVIALLDGLAQPVLPAMRESVSAESRALALGELKDAGVLPTT